MQNTRPSRVVTRAKQPSCKSPVAISNQPVLECSTCYDRWPDLQWAYSSTINASARVCLYQSIRQSPPFLYAHFACHFTVITAAAHCVKTEKSISGSNADQTLLEVKRSQRLEAVWQTIVGNRQRIGLHWSQWNQRPRSNEVDTLSLRFRHLLNMRFKGAYN